MDALDLTTGERLSGMKFSPKGSRRKATAPQRRQHSEDECHRVHHDVVHNQIETSSLTDKQDNVEEIETPPRPSSEGSPQSVDPESKQVFMPGRNLFGEFAQRLLAVRSEMVRSRSPPNERGRHFPLNANNNCNSPTGSVDVNTVETESGRSDIRTAPGTGALVPFSLMTPSGGLAMDNLMQLRLRRYLNDVQPAEAPGIPERTKKQNRWAFNVWREWARKRNTLEESFVGPYKGVPLDVGQASEEELDYWLCKFVMEIRRKDGNPYPPHTLMQIVMGIQRYLRQQAGKPTICILDRRNSTYSSFRSVLDYRIKELTNNGATSMKSRCRPVLLGNVTDEKYEAYAKKGLFPAGGDSRDLHDWKGSVMNGETAQGLLNGVFWHNYKSFGIQYIDDHWNLRAENFQIHDKGDAANGATFLEFTPSVTSMMAAAGKVNGTGVVSKKIYPDSPERREVFSIYQKYLSHTPKSGPFYRHPVDPTIVDRSIKFSDQWVGKNRLRAMLKNLIDTGGAKSRLKLPYQLSNRHMTPPVDKYATPMMQLSSGSPSLPLPGLQGHMELLKPLMRLQQQQHQRPNSVTLKEVEDESFRDSDSSPPCSKRPRPDTPTDAKIVEDTRSPTTLPPDDTALEIAVPKTITSITVIKGGRKITFHLE